jgi:hypothetical protein
MDDDLYDEDDYVDQLYPTEKEEEEDKIDSEDEEAIMTYYDLTDLDLKKK